MREDKGSRQDGAKREFLAIEQRPTWLERLDPEDVLRVALFGLDGVIAEFEPFIRVPDFLTEYGDGLQDELAAMAPKGVYLYGPPGCGKTSLVKQVAAKHGRTVFVISASSVLDERLGKSEQILRKIFTEVASRSETPVVLLIDEAESLFINREREHIGSYNLSIVKELFDLLEELDIRKVLIVLTSNLDSVMDPAIVDRFKAIEVPMPEQGAKKEMLSFLLERTDLSQVEKEEAMHDLLLDGGFEKQSPREIKRRLFEILLRRYTGGKRNGRKKPGKKASRKEGVAEKKKEPDSGAALARDIDGMLQSAKDVKTHQQKKLDTRKICRERCLVPMCWAVYRMMDEIRERHGLNDVRVTSMHEKNESLRKETGALMERVTSLMRGEYAKYKWWSKFCIREVVAGRLVNEGKYSKQFIRDRMPR